MASLGAWILTGCGVALVAIGRFFLAARPPLLPEDARYVGSPVDHMSPRSLAVSGQLLRPTGTTAGRPWTRSGGRAGRHFRNGAGQRHREAIG